MSLPKLTALAQTLPETVPFVGPEAIERRLGIPTRARLGANESGFGPSPRVLAALRDGADQVWTYPDPENFELRTALATHYGIAADEVTVGEGVDGVMGLLARLFIAPGDVVVAARGAYPTFLYHVVGFGGRQEAVPYRDAHEDIWALSDAVKRTGAKMVYLANPDNPMGSFWPSADISAFIASIPQDCLIVLDEAYGELAPDNDLPAIDTTQSNVLRLRSFSKAYGLAGLRCGYGIGDRRLIGAFNRVRNHFGVNRQAQVAALAALADQDYLVKVVGDIVAARDRIGAIARANGLVPLPSATNFVAIDCGRDAAYASAILNQLAQQGVFIRKPMTPGLDHHLRISAGPEAELAILEQALPIAIKAAQGAA